MAVCPMSGTVSAPDTDCRNEQCGNRTCYSKGVFSQIFLLQTKVKQSVILLFKESYCGKGLSNMRKFTSPFKKHNLLIFVFVQQNQHTYIFLELITGKEIFCKAKPKQESLS